MPDLKGQAPREGEHPRARTSPEPISVTVFACSDTGRVRPRNEDRFLVTDFATLSQGDDFSEAKSFTLRERGALLVVCDGLGGGPAGEVAAELAVDVVAAALADAFAVDDQALPVLIARALERANAEIRARAARHAGEEGMGTTATAALLRPGGMFVGHVGDSRCYVVRQGRLVRVTRNQTVAADLVDLGVMTPEEASTSNYRNVLRQAVGTSEALHVAGCRIALRRDDLILVCSDGLYAVLPRRTLERILVRGADLRTTGEALMQAVFEVGAPDNVTLALARVGGPGLPAPRADEPVSPEPS